MTSRAAAWVASFALAAIAIAEGPGGKASPRFVDIAAQAGVTATTWCGRDEKPHILESNGTGLGWLDYDVDGDLDLYLVNGWRLVGDRIAEKGRDVLYRNEGGGTFVDVTAAAGLGSDAWGSGLATGDVDGDGWTDLLVTNFGPDVLYRNLGDGSFQEIDPAPGIDGWSAGAVFFDADGDSDEDLYVGAYIDCTLDDVLTAERTLDWQDLKVMLGPFGLEGKANRYFENVGGGEFKEATDAAGLADKGLFYSFGVMALDLDQDLDLDLYVANDSNPNYVYENDGQGRFQEVGLWSGAALDALGNSQAGMGLAAGDLDADGRMDILVTNFQEDASSLYRNLGNLIFEDVTRSVNLDQATFEVLSWGTNLSDYDQDGDLDAFVANGHIYPQADLIPEVSGGFAQRNLLLLNENGVFVDATGSAGPGMEIAAVSHGLAVGDIDFDGDLDLAISNIDAPPTLLRNDGENLGRWLLVSAPAAISVDADAGGTRQFRHRVHGGSFLSVNDTRFHFGFGSSARVDSLGLVRSDGQRRVLRDLPADRAIVVPE